MLASKFIETELNAYTIDQRLTESPLMVKLICKAFEAYDEYRRLVSPSCKCNIKYAARKEEDPYKVAKVTKGI